MLDPTKGTKKVLDEVLVPKKRYSKGPRKGTRFQRRYWKSSIGTEKVLQKVLKSLQLVLKGTRKGIGKVLEKILGPTIGTQKVLEKILNPTKRTEKVLQNEVQVLTNVNIPSSSSSSCVISVII